MSGGLKLYAICLFLRTRARARSGNYILYGGVCATGSYIKRSSFSRRESFFMAASRIEAAERSFFRLFQASSTGPKEAVYLQPFPEL